MANEEDTIIKNTYKGDPVNGEKVAKEIERQTKNLIDDYDLPEFIVMGYKTYGDFAIYHYHSGKFSDMCASDIIKSITTLIPILLSGEDNKDLVMVLPNAHAVWVKLPIFEKGEFIIKEATNGKGRRKEGRRKEGRRKKR